MNRAETLPPAFSRFEEMWGVLDFAVFEDATGSEEEMLAAVPQALGASFTVDVERLRSLARRPIPENVFFGDWYDPASGKLLSLGNYITDNGDELQDPKLIDLSGLRIKSSSAALPEPGAGGQFAYAFSSPPYSLRAMPEDIQATFDEIRAFILPRKTQAEIFDWTDPRLVDVSEYFSAGMEWWGIFLFSIYVPSLRRLTIVAGSTTD